MNDNSESGATLKSRLAHEFKVYGAISLYLFVCFGVVQIYDASQSENAQLTLLTLGVALTKALVLGKFILIGEILKPGTRISAQTLLHRMAWRTVGLLGVLLVLKMLEELVIGLIHGNSFSVILGELVERSWLSLLGPILLMLLILIPLVTAIELNRVIGNEGLKELLLSRE